MLNGRDVSLDTDANNPDCAFCQRSDFAHNILKETQRFLIVADHAPLVEGHLLIIPKRHYACYGAVPAALDTELLALKREVGLFFDVYYAPVVFWEHGIFRQTVFHAHLHCFPFGGTQYNPAEGLHSVVVHSQDDIRTWYAKHGEYFYLEDKSGAFLFAPEMDRYLQVIRQALWSGVVSHSKQVAWRSQQQRYEEGGPFIKAATDKWHIFTQEVGYADETSTR